MKVDEKKVNLMDYDYKAYLSSPGFYKLFTDINLSYLYQITQKGESFGQLPTSELTKEGGLQELIASHREIKKKEETLEPHLTQNLGPKGWTSGFHTLFKGQAEIKEEKPVSDSKKTRIDIKK